MTGWFNEQKSGRWFKQQVYLFQESALVGDFMHHPESKSKINRLNQSNPFEGALMQPDA